MKLKRLLAATVLTVGLVFSPIGGYQQPAQAETCIEVEVCWETWIGTICGSIEICWGEG